MTTTLCGIRHHGPGSARALAAALDRVRPDVVLVEGPPEGQDLVTALARDDISFPAALMLHAPDDAGIASFYPLVEYSPELVAIRWAVHSGVPIRFFDAPYSVTSTMDRERSRDTRDPLATVAHLMGYEDAEVWWEDTFETANHDPLEAFEALVEIMTVLRAEAEAEVPTGDLDRLREAHMRLGLSQAEKEHGNVLAVVGAWHLPALDHRAVTKDRALVRELTGPKVKLVTSLVPWSDRRLSQGSGYGAGVPSPGWYAHLWNGGDHLVERWLTHTAGVLRENGFPASTASVIEAVNLASMVATLRDRHTPNLEDLLEATQAVLTEGRPEPLRVVHDQLVVGQRIGVLPDDAPQGPLALDLARLQKRLQLKPSHRGPVTLDLREPTGLARSELLHRLQLLGVGWGTLQASSGKGTFKEVWDLRWEPEHSLDLALRAHLGSTIEAAAEAQVAESALDADLATASSLVAAALVANLPAALEVALRALDRAAASSGDVEALLASLEPLGQTLRYGSARLSAPEHLAEVFSATLARAATTLPGQARALDDDAARELLPTLAAAHGAVGLNADEHDQGIWRAALSDVSDSGAPRLAGWCTRQLLDVGALEDAAARLLVDRYLTTAPPSEGVLWLEGLLTGSAALLLRDQHLWQVLDEWLTNLPEDDFSDNVPLLRRTFSAYSPAERRRIGERVAGADARATVSLDLDRALAALPTTLRILERT